jgi:hypothetical protein
VDQTAGNCCCSFINQSGAIGFSREGARRVAGLILQLSIQVPDFIGGLLKYLYLCLDGIVLPLIFHVALAVVHFSNVDLDLSAGSHVMLAGVGEM